MRFGTSPLAGGPKGSSWSGCVPTPPARPCGECHTPGYSATASPGYSAPKPLPPLPLTQAHHSAVRPVVEWRPPRRWRLWMLQCGTPACSASQPPISPPQAATPARLTAAPAAAGWHLPR
eukprot:scaffold64864_cov64-Phaeocystis_antarctica.AAC.1